MKSLPAPSQYENLATTGTTINNSRSNLHLGGSAMNGAVVGLPVRGCGVHAVVRGHSGGRAGRRRRRCGLVAGARQLVRRAGTARRDRGAAVGRDLAVRRAGIVPLALGFARKTGHGERNKDVSGGAGGCARRANKTKQKSSSLAVPATRELTGQCVCVCQSHWTGQKVFELQCGAVIGVVAVPGLPGQSCWPVGHVSVLATHSKAPVVVVAVVVGGWHVPTVAPSAITHMSPATSQAGLARHWRLFEAVDHRHVPAAVPIEQAWFAAVHAVCASTLGASPTRHAMETR